MTKYFNKYTLLSVMVIDILYLNIFFFFSLLTKLITVKRR